MTDNYEVNMDTLDALHDPIIRFLKRWADPKIKIDTQEPVK